MILGLVAITGCSAAAGDETDSQTSELRNTCGPTNRSPFCDPPPPANECSGASGTISVTPQSVMLGQSVTVSWNAVLPANCGEQVLLDGIPVNASGSQTFTPKYNQLYALAVAGTRLAATPTVAVTLPSVVHIADSSTDSRLQMIQALELPNERVVLEPGVDMDMTGSVDQSGSATINIAPGVTFTSERPLEVVIGPPVVQPRALLGGSIFNLPRPQARTPSDPGPRIYTHDHVPVLFSIGHSDNVTISGFRIQGPDWDPTDDASAFERGIEVASSVNVDISNMELSGWSWAAIQVEDPDHRATGPDNLTDVRIHDNFIHHNQHIGEDGYGVDVQTAWATIERNVFDFNRHAITASGHPGTGYDANQNLVLKGGGYQGKLFDTWIQVFDVHGDQDCALSLPDSLRCGTAGTWFRMTNNAFQFNQTIDIEIRGTPTDLVNIMHNVFARGSQDDAIGETQGMWNINIAGDNQYNIDTFGEYGVCDIDGDGKDDLFLATGTSWWYMSAGKHQWSYLSPNTERLKDVRLGDFDGDHRCDVLAYDHGTDNLEIASGGSGAWTPLPAGYSGIPIEKIAVGDFDGDGITDLFYRDDGGGWNIASPGHYDWQYLGGSSQTLDSLKFGDFDGNGITDVLGHNAGQWAISWGGRSSWQPAGGGMNDDFTNVYVGNVDGQPGDDIIRYSTADKYYTGHWDVSSGARTSWQSLATYGFPLDPGSDAGPAATANSYIGKFSGYPGADILMLDPTRMSKIFSLGHTSFSQYGVYAY